MSYEQDLRREARLTMEPKIAQLMECLQSARASGATEPELEHAVQCFLGQIEAGCRKLFAPRIVKLLVAEVADSYHKQAEPPTETRQ